MSGNNLNSRLAKLRNNRQKIHNAVVHAKYNVLEPLAYQRVWLRNGPFARFRRARLNKKIAAAQAEVRRLSTQSNKIMANLKKAEYAVRKRNGKLVPGNEGYNAQEAAKRAAENAVRQVNKAKQAVNKAKQANANAARQVARAN